MFWNSLPVLTLETSRRPPECKMGWKPIWEIRYTHFRTFSNQGWHEHDRNATLTSSCPVYGRYYYCPFCQWDQYGVRLALKTGQIFIFIKIKIFFHSWANRCMGLRAEIWLEGHKLRRHKNFMSSFIRLSFKWFEILKRTERTEVNPLRRWGCGGQRRMGIEEMYSCFLLLSHSKGSIKNTSSSLKWSLHIFLEFLLFYRTKD